jgi:hypothetical protein
MNKLKEKNLRWMMLLLLILLNRICQLKNLLNSLLFLNYKISKGWTMEKIVNNINNGSLNVSVSNVRK